MIPSVRYSYISVSGNSHASRFAKHTWILFVRVTKFLYKNTIRIKYLHIEVLQVCNRDVSLGVYSNPSGAAELAVVAAFFSNLSHKLPFSVKLLQPKISCIWDQNVVVLVNGNMSRAVEFSFAISVHTEVHDRLAFGVEDVYSVIIALSDDDSTFGVQSEATGTF